LAVGVMMGLAAHASGLAAAGASGAAPGDPVKGEKIYAAQKCNLCHKIGTAGGKLGPDLSAVGTRRDAAWMEKYLQNPKLVDAKNKMPVVKVKGQDLADLIAYLETLGKKK
jgi:cytochrome c2